jgi:hypothetical protein
MGDAEDPRRCAAAPGFEAAAALQQRQEGGGGEIGDVGRIAEAAGCGVKHQVTMAAEDQIRGRGVRLDPTQHSASVGSSITICIGELSPERYSRRGAPEAGRVGAASELAARSSLR